MANHVPHSINGPTPTSAGLTSGPMIRSSSGPAIGLLLREWRQRRRLSQLDLANLAGVTARHLSFVETGRSRPSREMVLHLAEHLDVPLRERNTLLLSAGYAPTFRETDLDAPNFQAVRQALERILAGHEPFPALIVDRHWNLVSANTAAGILVEGVSPALLEPPINVLRVSVHPEGLGPRIANLDEWAEHTLGRLRREALVTGDAELLALEAELEDLVAANGVELRRHPGEAPTELAITMRLRSDAGELALIATIATFGTALDITLAELVLEAFLPADAATAQLLAERKGS